MPQHHSPLSGQLSSGMQAQLPSRVFPRPTGDTRVFAMAMHLWAPPSSSPLPLSGYQRGPARAHQQVTHLETRLPASPSPTSTGNFLGASLSPGLRRGVVCNPFLLHPGPERK